MMKNTLEWEKLLVSVGSQKSEALVESLLLIMPVPFYEAEGQYWLDEQTCDCLVRWAENFDRILLACPILPKHLSPDNVTLGRWRAIAELPCAEQVELVPLPYAYKIQDFIRVYRSTRQLLSAKIAECDYLCFVIGGMIGDWGGIASLEAIKLQRPYSVWTDRVEYEVIRQSLKNLPLKSQVKEAFNLPLMKRYQQYLISHSSLGLFQGQDCYQAYSAYCQEPHCVYYVNTKKSDRIDASHLKFKINSVLAGKPLRICYAGRATEMKGSLDWLQAVNYCYKSGVNLQATWLGDGPQLEEMKSLAQDLGISSRLHFPGFIGDRATILETIKDHHIFLFCHKTPESARCLIEALVCGCPIVGYDSFYPRGLVSEHGGGGFGLPNDWRSLGDLLIQLNSDRLRLSELIRCAALSGQPFDVETVFQNQSNLIKKYLTEVTK